MDRFKQTPLWQWGLLCILGGIVSNFVTGLIVPTSGGSAAERGAAFGRGLASITFIVSGIALIVVHFLKAKKKPKKRKRS